MTACSRRDLSHARTNVPAESRKRRGRKEHTAAADDALRVSSSSILVLQAVFEGKVEINVN
ncbi:uncharacterized protein LOC105422120 isoform X4 [Pogonomyrmex barbatus]|uniref:Uncharacterized protein LOC105422120 isoform X4 n=1 Tax=Pogonomyrmex barbatus TaxID=144034 RepID=A0A6I9VMF8_9HYME|nr:uncharacterized protein LOC105422120 isoform X4 [Pogonomyrmex barbatus]